MTASPPLFIATSDLAAVTRGRAVPAREEAAVLRRGVGWVPADLAITSFGKIAPNVFGSAGDLRLLPVPAARVQMSASGGLPGTSLHLAEQVHPDGRPWECCPRSFARFALDDFKQATGLDVIATFEHEFTLGGLRPTAPFSFERYRSAEPFGSQLLLELEELGLEPENWLPEYGADQFEITLSPTDALQAADRAILLKEVVRDLARRHGRQVSFAPLPDPDGSGNGVHVHLSLRDADGRPALYDPARPGGLSELGSRFAAGILNHAPALSAITAASPASFLRLQPHRWSAGGIFLGERNREALVRICPTSTLGGGQAAEQYNLEYRAADATANAWLTLGVLIRAGLRGITETYDSPHPWPEGATQEDLAGVPALPGNLTEALAELEKDTIVADWFHPHLLDTFTSVKRAEIEHVHNLDPSALCEEVSRVH
ncbi:glutamine synthetase [Streptomyces sp. NPDC056697]|uniref:glutamine synthetase n=1 Tax=Streptomyces sp. NPDC056697 TaxID=3345915 RepID=UPI003684B811